MLVRQEETEQLEAFGEIEKAIEKFATHLVDDDVMIDGEKREKGRFFNGRQTPGLVDLTLFPWAWRLPVFETHRDERFKIDPAKSVGLRKYMRWLRDMVSRDDVSRTLPNWEEYLQHITRYADGSRSIQSRQRRSRRKKRARNTTTRKMTSKNNNNNTNNRMNDYEITIAI